jgi:phage-related protein (TIGR01555 family)
MGMDMSENIKVTDKVENSLGELVGAFASSMMQSNLTSFTPLYSNNSYAPLTLNWTNLTYMYKSQGLIQKMIDMPVQDAFRGGFDLACSTLNNNNLVELEDWMAEMGVIDRTIDTICWGRLYGGSGLIINAFDFPNLKFSYPALIEGPVMFYDANRWELNSPVKESPQYMFYGNPIDRSRVILYSGKRAPHIIRQQLQGWGMSELERIVPDLLLFLRHRNVLYELLEEAKVDVYRVEGLEETLMSQEGVAKVFQRIQLTNQMKNYNNAVIMPHDDEYEQKQLSFSGLGDINEAIKGWLSCMTGIPQTKLFGQSASGFNSGEDDIENYNMMIESEIRYPLRNFMRRVFNICAYACFGAEHNIHFRFKPLREMSSEQEEHIKSSKHTRYAADLDRGITTPQEYAIICHKEGITPIETAALHGEVDRDDLLAATGMSGDAGGGESDGGMADKSDGDGKVKSKDGKKYGNWMYGPSGALRRRAPSGGWEYKSSNK